MCLRRELLVPLTKRENAHIREHSRFEPERELEDKGMVVVGSNLAREKIC